MRLKDVTGAARPRSQGIDVDTLDATGPDSRGFLLWLLLLSFPVRDIVLGRVGPWWAASLALATLAVLYAATVRTAFDGRFPLRVPVTLFVVLTAAGAVVVALLDRRWSSVYALVGLAAGSVGGHLPRARRGVEWPLLLCVGGPVAVVMLSAWWGGADAEGVLGSAYAVGTAGLVTAIVIRLFGVIGMLRAAREELARAAVEAERLRFSRDLHDLLGHTLSLMVVKAQAVRLLAARDPAVAAAQAADIEDVGRRALGEVRQAVSGYRGRGLAAELEAARTALADAGVRPVIRSAGDALPGEADALLGWVVREGVTNVIRHSGARTCEITLRHGGGEAVVQVRDDGAGPAPGAPGNGLRGLAERLAEAGGSVAAGPGDGGGYALTATVGTEQWAP
ncbi:sensor histidine kinase [Actinomadura parmotrematis]|uniref:Signal transduction histidine kinase subgroup 3 dimerisation and phosphoacceptor domain-containing protein n=1 Tax=Actinomadura parmotrematis TaxID=2864039 RepID=A0ABS7FWX9_9ACTN|nr:histidine kinase [Actinomadura parmotrematis]MBW8484933.1 hypothetical protein [Actinomadura parmotrematis]